LSLVSDAPSHPFHAVVVPSPPLPSPPSLVLCPHRRLDLPSVTGSNSLPSITHRRPDPALSCPDLWRLERMQWSARSSTRTGKDPSGACRMDLPGPTTSVGTKIDYSLGPWDYLAWAARHLLTWSTRISV
jgi:hypothetical protein